MILWHDMYILNDNSINAIFRWSIHFSNFSGTSIRNDLLQEIQRKSGRMQQRFSKPTPHGTRARIYHLIDACNCGFADNYEPSYLDNPFKMQYLNFFLLGTESSWLQIQFVEVCLLTLANLLPFFQYRLNVNLDSQHLFIFEFSYSKISSTKMK